MRKVVWVGSGYKGPVFSTLHASSRLRILETTNDVGISGSLLHVSSNRQALIAYEGVLVLSYVASSPSFLGPGACSRPLKHTNARV